MLARLTSPWSGRAKIVISAGIRAFGTWGATEFLRTRADELYARTKGNDFGVVLKVTQENFGISAEMTPSIVVGDMGDAGVAIASTGQPEPMG